MSAEFAIEAREVCKVFGQGEHAVNALDDVSVAIRQGEFFTLLGPSGCGKTTLLRLIAGFESPTSGSIFLDGQDITDLPPNKRPVNTVFQSYALFPHLSVAENIGFGLQMLGRPKAEIAARTEEMLALVKLEALAVRKTAQLSGGQQQRVALARALAPRPKLLLLDEPLSALDLKLRKEMQGELKRLQCETGITFVFVTHDQEEALTMSDRVGVMSSGKILQIGPPRAIYAHPVNRFVADFIGETNFIPAQIVDGHAVLPGGVSLPMTGTHPAGPVTLAIRPEHLRLTDREGERALLATVSHSVYFGTDSHVHLRLADNTELIARLQMDAEGAGGPDPGAAVGVAFAPGAVQVLED
ncbi:Spermidine/putrescine import ATP-binding protein PotA [Defluviimonas aquaemixtae]|uniref:Spermidine/putrescine import ATP-binding protein PotA n=1 Tax=Albidovulum aquaemixtae TaxID=1542388 RepID=A0A2R8B767_9RHOB|nr:ABC transporter ATP-binding protein [Defluviimonas aquaemixtae]SPH18446.1 Spermidine/putrescine import ATP-binding protein PotA [Defluviimonas aquaemixtae]